MAINDNIEENLPEESLPSDGKVALNHEEYIKALEAAVKVLQDEVEQLREKLLSRRVSRKKKSS